jgi:hypothetical protein
MTKIKIVKKYTFVLKNIKSEEIEKKYGIKLISNITEVDNNIPTNSTKISELDFMPEKIISFLDEHKRIHKCNISMIDFNKNQNIQSFKYNCYWCKHSFNNNPIGCPIKYISHTVSKTYNSEISKDKYIIKENITNKNKTHNQHKDLLFSNECYYETDGIFCSFNCTIAYINDNKHNIMYDNSYMLLSKIYFEMSGNTMTLTSAPHWRLLDIYGGHLTINEFRDSFNKSEYINYGTIKPIADFRSIGSLYEQKLKF